ncbi:hypothetical protein [Achromobacter kerstersii]|uniref:hypothetical protein n=1 Tax=Achromobacter kerstersii TaxID=1353890 RepID=UPI0006C56811|nr:hypothetical protein [Achromobacter kerstersii]CUI27238.1 Uncharacterised protein [Achromobacter kerstersii]
MQDATQVVHMQWSAAAKGFAPGKQVATKQSRPFIKGPIGLDWIGAAARLPGKSLHVALALQYLAGLQRAKTVKLNAKTLDTLGVARDAKYEALRRLELAGLISTKAKPGRQAIVTLLDAPAVAQGGEHE